MIALDRLVAEGLADPLAAARAHAAEGGRVIGYWSANVPLELLLAADAFPLHLPHFGLESTPRADHYLEPLFDRALRAAFDRWLAGDFDFLQAIVLPRSLDSAQRVYYYAEELRRTGLLSGPPVWLFDLQAIQRPSSAAFTLRRARQLAEQLGVAPAMLEEGIGRMNRRRLLLQRLAARQQAGRIPDAGFTSRVLQAAQYAPFDAFDAALEAWLQAPSGSSAGTERGIVLAGSTPADDAIHAAVGAGGGLVLQERHLSAADRHGPPVPTGKPDPLAAIAGVYHSGVPSMRRIGVQLADAVAPAAECRAAGLVLWLTEEDEAFAWQVPALLERAATARLPVLALARQPWRVPATTAERIRRFVSSLEVTR